MPGLSAGGQQGPPAPQPAIPEVTQAGASLLSPQLSQAVSPRGVQVLRLWLGLGAAEPRAQPGGASTGTGSAFMQGTADARAAQALGAFLAAHCSFYPAHSPVIYCRNWGEYSSANNFLSLVSNFKRNSHKASHSVQ